MLQKNRVVPTRVVESNLLTMGACAAAGDWRQAIPSEPKIPDENVLGLRAKLIFEEAMETIRGLGTRVFVPAPDGSEVEIIPSSDFCFVTDRNSVTTDLEEIIDGCCDTIYVAVGTMLACGVDPDMHLDHVCDCNDAKFPEGKAIIRQSDGKFQKPEGWKAPDHARLMEGENENMARLSATIVNGQRPMKNKYDGKPGHAAAGWHPDHDGHG